MDGHCKHVCGLTGACEHNPGRRREVAIGRQQSHEKEPAGNPNGCEVRGLKGGMHRAGLTGDWTLQRTVSGTWKAGGRISGTAARGHGTKAGGSTEAP